MHTTCTCLHIRSCLLRNLFTKLPYQFIPIRKSTISNINRGVYVCLLYYLCVCLQFGLEGLGSDA